jgi:1-deoxy-D-xylulose-5-phosphate reductoisomerase
MTTPRVAIAGATGSIGLQTLDVCRAEADRYDLVAIGASGRLIEPLVDAAREFSVKVVAVADPAAVGDLEHALPGCEIRGGPDALASLAADADVVVNGVVGFAGLDVTLATLTAGRRLALANKESLIAAGPVVQQAWRTPGAELVPVDSEHCALHQCLRANDNPARVARLVLTASGGPFRTHTATQLASVGIDDALAHPTWSMGPKITIDSSTLMNKGLEVIEAHELFGPGAPGGPGVALDAIEVVVHPQSVIHSMVEYTDGSTIAQLSMPDMRLPIAYALAWPDRSAVPAGRIDWSTLSRLEFEPPDTGRFPCLALAYEAARVGGTAPAWLSAANEVAVDAFLAGRISWTRIAEVVAEALDAHDGARADSVDDVYNADAQARRVAADAVTAGSRSERAGSERPGRAS